MSARLKYIPWGVLPTLVIFELISSSTIFINVLMTLLRNLELAIENALHGVSQSELAKAAKALSIRYREGKDSASKTPFLLTKLDRLAYVAVRMKATYQAIVSVFYELADNSSKPESLLDLGAGAGAGLWAFCEVFDGPNQATLVELDEQFMKLGEALSKDLGLKNSVWFQQNLCQAKSFPSHDVVLMSYSLGELSAAHQKSVLLNAWNAAQHALVVIEPGTKRGFATIIEARTTLLAQGGHLLAPCPHEVSCPMVGTRDWCHFKARLNRSSTHRYLKSAELGFEDENYSYMIFTKVPSTKAESRVVGQPEHHTGHVCLRLCQGDGIKKIIYSKKQGELYRKAKKVRLGDRF